MSFTLAVELHHEHDVDPEVTRALEAMIAGRLERWVQDQWSVYSPHVVIRYSDQDLVTCYNDLCRQS
jgi:hypothetical protein